MILPIEKIESNLTKGTYSTQVCPPISITGVVKLLISQSVCLFIECQVIAVYWHSLHHTEHGPKKGKEFFQEKQIIDKQVKGKGYEITSK